MANKAAGWAWFDDVASVDADAQDDTERAAKIFARCFRGDDGDAALRYLRHMTLDRALGSSVSDAGLRHVEGQRQLVAHILALVDRGRSGATPTPNSEKET